MSYDDRQVFADEDQRGLPVDFKTLWSGGAAAALVAALIGLVGNLVVTGLLELTLVRPGLNGLFPGTRSLDVMLHGAFLALAATALMNVLLLGTPRARAFFSWIMGLITVVITIAPLSHDDVDWASRVSSGIVYLITGIAITSLIAGVATSAIRVAARRIDAQRAAAQRAEAERNRRGPGTAPPPPRYGSESYPAEAPPYRDYP